MIKSLRESKWQIINSFSIFALVVAFTRFTQIFLQTFPSQIARYGILALVFGRTFVVSGDYGNHTIVFFLVFFTMIGNILLTPRGKWFKDPKAGFLGAIITAFQVPALHETIWNASWIILHGFSSNMIPIFKSPLEATSLWLLAGPIGIFIYFWFFRKDRRALLFHGVLAWGIWLFYFVWILAGFPITLNFNGATTLFYDFNTNLFWEIGSWVYSCGLFLVLRVLVLHLQKLRELYAKKELIEGKENYLE